MGKNAELLMMNGRLGRFPPTTTGMMDLGDSCPYQTPCRRRLYRRRNDEEGKAGPRSFVPLRMTMV